MRRALLILTVGLFSGSASGQVEAWTTLEPPVTPFHQPAVLTLYVESPAGLDLELPDLRKAIGELPVKGAPEFQSSLVGEDRVLRQERYVLDPIKVEDHVIGAVTVSWEGGELSLPGQVFRARELTEEERAAAETFDGALIAATSFIHPPIWTRWEFWSAVAVILTAALVIAWTLWRSRGETYLSAPPKPAWEVAFDRLAALEKRGLIASGQYEPYYVDLSAILRYYIEGRFDLQAPERTTPEFLDEVTGKEIFTPEQERFLASFLRQGDRVKFARHEPDAREMEVHFAEVRTFVEETVPNLNAAPPKEKAA